MKADARGPFSDPIGLLCCTALLAVQHGMHAEADLIARAVVPVAKEPLAFRLSLALVRLCAGESERAFESLRELELEEPSNNLVQLALGLVGGVTRRLDGNIYLERVLATSDSPDLRHLAYQSLHAG